MYCLENDYKNKLKIQIFRMFLNNKISMFFFNKTFGSFFFVITFASNWIKKS